MDVAVSQMAEAGGNDAWKFALDLGRRLDDEPRHVGHGDGDVMRKRLAFRAFGLGNEVANLPEGIGLRFARGEHGVPNDPFLEGLHRATVRVARRRRSPPCSSSLRSTRANHDFRERRPGTADMLDDELEAIFGTSSKPSTLSVCA